ncbi:MAG: RpiB/LacA/LacB family sugar-phosphate isomerase [Bacteroidales bacterium]|nr:RpiB/LacA/LacB family sugar-phosphate isomerase [Bacteroidales bacterium]
MEKKIFEKIGLASDHAGFEMKEFVKNWLAGEGYEVMDFGCYSPESCDYPDYAHPLADAVSKQVCQVGLSLCGSGNGINMVVNKHAKIRSALCWNREIASLARRHNDANILALPARFLNKSEILIIVNEFLATGFEGGRHLRRIQKIPING